MKRIVLIAAAGFALLSSIGLGVYLYQRQSGATKTTATARHLAPKPGAAASNSIPPRTEDVPHLVADLGQVQDKIVYGDRSALADQGRLLAKISSVLRNFPKKNWEDYENIRSAFVYVLSGGDYGVLQPLIESGVLSEADKTLAEGIGLYARGQSSAARKILLDIDPRSLDVSLVGPFALARASFYIGHDNKKAIEFLDEARLAAPHTAIEEAAVRREIALLVEAGDRPRAVMLMADYVRRFGKSIYAWKLFQDFATALAKQDDQDGSGVVEDLASTTTTADKNARTKLFLNLAGEALLYGKIVLAKAAAKATLHLKPESQIDVDKATLYEAAASAPTANAERALKTLNGLAGDHLSDDDSEIHEVADYIARTVSGDDIKADAKPGVRPIGPAADAKRSASSLALPRVAGAIESADAALKHADMLISRNEQ
ncbi:hypothetical protein [Hyphomicrobium sp.]|jgi:chemotaxis protein MotC|uniref:hypothetical protein n=1 Tax=Hyphomicrobium sp. TaxID=82 RepID=UPI002D000A44|nr:hypothetical protein [Hyphomicrobium sp.]HVZ04391.1 hypothetical protein [Hyphomicrobium sp.]